MISTLIALPYKIARAPLAFVDNTLADHLPETSMPRTTLDLVLGSTDKFAGALLGDERLGRRGAERIERSDTLRKAARFEHHADARRKEAKQTVTAARDEAERKRDAAQDRAAESLEVADVVEAREKREAKAEARSTAAAKKRAADEEAKQRTATIEQRKRRASSTADAKKKATQRQAKKKIDHARASQQAAVHDRAEAEQLENLVDAKRQSRKESD